ncbi:hypothetical protein CIPAW_11G154000 [Carya illinoinensis]|uniref:Uncharacterized protein n=1 Tax=Carya illinoinensis TaxID=32201 RepID=A0A8T1NXX5_CARIL|nr:hypothetical protein CIPAW_11G154000 [Carya illinoinensis]
MAGDLSLMGKDQFCAEDGRGMSRQKMETLLQAVAEMEKQVSSLQSNLALLKRCVEEGGRCDAFLGHLEGPCSGLAHQELVHKGKGLVEDGPKGKKWPEQQAQPIEQAQPIVQAQSQQTHAELSLRAFASCTDDPSSSGGPQRPQLAMGQGSPAKEMVPPMSYGMEDDAAGKVTGLDPSGSSGSDQCGTTSTSSELGEGMFPKGRALTASSRTSYIVPEEPTGLAPSLGRVNSSPASSLLTEIAQKMSPEVDEGIVIPSRPSDASKGSPLLSGLPIEPVNIDLGGFEGKSVGDGLLVCELGGVEGKSLRDGSRVSENLLAPRVKSGFSVSASTLNMQLALTDSDFSDEDGTVITPLCTLPPSPVYGSDSSSWVFKKVEEIQAIVGISIGGYTEQFRALLVAIEDSHSKSATKRDRELKRLTCSIKYDVKEGSGGRDRSKGRGQ